MLAESGPCCQAPLWKRELAAAITRPEELFDILDLDPGLLPAALEAAKGFRFLAPRGYVALMERSNPHDPLLRQILPQAAELQDPPDFCADPTGERAAVRTPGLLQKYRGRALVLITGACAVHCRYCFRRHFPYAEQRTHSDRIDGAVALLAEDPSISEVILSGGDPLMLDDSALKNLVDRLAPIEHLQRLRVHTRLPVILPTRVTDDLCRILTASRLQPIVVVHTNHSRELGDASKGALTLLRRAGIPLLNQSVLLRGVNDEAHLLAELSEALFPCGVLPYYLHMLDRVKGAAHFDLDEATAVRIVDELSALLPGYLVPRLVREIPGRTFKVPVGPGTLKLASI